MSRGSYGDTVLEDGYQLIAFDFIGTAERFEQMGVRSKDALHLACAVAMKCEYFLTTDDQLVKKVSGVTEIKVTDPVSFIREEIE